MVLKLYVSRCSGSMEIKKKQEFIFHMLDARQIEYEEVDITDPQNEEEKNFMRAHGTVKEGQRCPLPPQIFHDTEYLGDYDAFHEACEMEELYQFIKQPPPQNTVDEAGDQADDAVNSTSNQGEDDEEEEEKEEES